MEVPLCNLLTSVCNFVPSKPKVGALFWKSHCAHHFTSLHPDHCKQAIPYSQLLRLRRICSDNDDFAARATEMKAFFQARGYPEALLNDDLCKISTVSRRVPLVLTYNQFNTGTKRILLDNFEMLLSDPATRTIFPELPLVSYRRDRNLRDYLVHSAERSDSDAGTFACRHPRCLTCRHTSSQTILQSPKRLYTIRDRFTCQSENVVYSIICRRCGCLYIGETEGGCGNVSLNTCVAFETILLDFL